MFKCDLCVLNYLMIKPKNIFECFISFWKCFCVSLVFWKFFQKAKSVLLRNSYTSIFASVSRVRLLAPKLQKWGSEFPFLPKFYIESLATTSQVIHKKWLPAKLHLCIWGISWETRKSLASTYPAKWAVFQFLNRHTVTVFQTFYFSSLVSLSIQNTLFTQISTKTQWISFLRLL